MSAAKEHLGDQMRNRSLPSDPQWLRMWLDLCWEAEDWQEAKYVAQRLGAAGEDQATGDFRQRSGQA